MSANASPRPTWFAIRDSELESIAPTEAFVLGIEWGMIWQRAQLPSAARLWVHTSNERRVVRLLEIMKRDFILGQPTAGMVELSISGLD